MGKIVTIYLSDEEARELKDFCDDNQCTSEYFNQYFERFPKFLGSRNVSDEERRSP